MHRIFGYRGVILFPWRAKVYDRNAYMPSYVNSTSDDLENMSTANKSNNLNCTRLDSTQSADNSHQTVETDTTIESNKHNIKKINETSSDNDSISARPTGNKEITVNVHTYYQVLIDSRDCPHVVRNLKLHIFFKISKSWRKCLLVLLFQSL